MARAALIILAALILAPRCVHSRERFTFWDARYLLTHPTDSSVCALPPKWSALDRTICRAVAPNPTE